MKINRRTLHKILVEYQKLMKSDERKKVYWINHLMMKDLARKFELPFYKGTKYRGKKHWLANSSLYRELRKIRRGDEVNDRTINYRRRLDFYCWFYLRDCPIDKTSKL